MTPSTTSKELSERLKALGVPQTSYFVWIKPPWSEDAGYALSPRFIVEESNHAVITFAAFTAGELGEILPYGYASSRYADNAFTCFGDFPDAAPATTATSEAEARGLMLEYLLTNGLLQTDAI